MFALYNRKLTFMAFSTLLVMAEYANSGIWGHGFISDILVSEGVCVTGYKVIFMRYSTSLPQVYVYTQYLAASGIF